MALYFLLQFIRVVTSLCQANSTIGSVQRIFWLVFMQPRCVIAVASKDCAGIHSFSWPYVL